MAVCQDEFLKKPYVRPDFTGLRLLILGLGGGCDIILAYALTKLLRQAEAAEIVYANTKRTDNEQLRHVSEHVRRVSDWQPTLTPSMCTYGTTAIDHSVPRGDRDCPFVFLLPRRAAESALVPEILALGFDVLVAVDTGGDSVVDAALSGSEGRDKQMLRVLQATGSPLWHVVVAPGSDGESSYRELREAFEDLAERGRFVGCLALDPVVPLLKQLSTGLAEDRTPNIIVAAAENRLEGAPGGWLTVPRGRCPDVPRSWLTHAFVFTYDSHLRPVARYR